MTQRKPVACFFTEYPGLVDELFSGERRDRLNALFEFLPITLRRDNVEQHAAELARVEYLWSTWGARELSPEQIQTMPNLKAVFYCAGTVKNFAAPLLAAGVRIFSAWGSNALPVAQLVTGQILLSCKGYFRNTRNNRLEGTWTPAPGPGIYEAPVALLGFGMIGRLTAQALQPFGTRLSVVDPYVDPDLLARYDARPTCLEAAFAENLVVSNHLPNLPTTRKILTEAMFRSMPTGATFINTGRGAQVDEEGMIRVLQERPDLTALLDVSDPEPPLPGSPLYSLPNVMLSSHLAGATHHERGLLVDAMIAEYERFRDGGALTTEVTLDLWDRLA